MKKTKLYFLLTALLFAGSAMAQSFYFSPNVTPKNDDLTKLVTADGSANIAVTTTGSKGTSSKSLNPTPTSIVDGKTAIATNLYYKLADTQTIKFTTTATADIKVLFAGSSSDECSLALTNGNSEEIEKITCTKQKLVPFVLSATNCPADTYTFTANKKEMFVYEILVTYASAKDDATLNSITVNGKEVEDFAPETTTYNVELPFGTTEVPFVAATATSSNAKVSVTQAESVDGTATITVTAEDGTTKKTYTINFTVADPNQDATLSAITVDGEPLEGFSPEQLTYSMELAYGTKNVPTVTATTTDKNATSIIKYVDAEGAETNSLPCTATITVTAEDTKVSQTYSIAFTTAASASEDATLASISIDGKAIADFKADSLDYTHTIAYAAKAIPEVTAVVHDETANINISQANAVPGTATIVVTAQAGNKQTYTVTISRAAAIKHLTVVPFTNGAKGAINDTTLTVTAPYMIGEDVPTVDGEHIAVSGDGTPTATLSEDGATITLKGADNVEAVYTVVTKALTPNTMTANEVTFTGEETYIFAPYGFDTEKGRGWKFAKKVNEEGNMRDASGNTRIYMALPPAESVILTSGTQARAVVISVNGGESYETTTADAGKTITIALKSATNNFVAIESNQTGGDGGFTKIQLVNPSDPIIGSAVEEAQVETKAVKVIRDGQLLIIREGKTYTAQGVQVQ